MADPARRAAYEVLAAVHHDDAYANLALGKVLAARRLAGRDAAFATELVSGTLRGRGTYDAVLAACSSRPLAEVDPIALDVLRLGTHQLLGTRVPAHAAISSSVELVRRLRRPGAAGFVNAVLRKVGARDRAAWVDVLAPSDPTERLALEHSHPAWVVDALASALGEAELPDLLAADNLPPRVTLVARPGRSTRDELPGEPTPFSPYGVVLASGAPGEVPAVAQGRAGVQDEGSQLMALALADADVTADRGRWLDLCAGPGGKASLLAALAGERGADLVAVERAPHRAALVARALTGSPGVRGVIAADGTRPPLADATFDRVLVDAPCSGLGALRRRSEARWRRAPEDLDALVPLQGALLDRALRLVRPGGVVAYATCSPVLAETVGVVETVLAGRPDVELLDAPATLSQVSGAEGPLPGTLQLWPHRHGTDAMFLALLRRTAAGPA